MTPRSGALVKSRRSQTTTIRMMTILNTLMVWWNPLIAALVTLLMTLGFTYLFYPAIIAAYAQDRYASLQLEDVASQTTTTAADTSNTTRSQPHLSLVIPAYNEESRLPVMLKDTYEYLSAPNCRALQKLAATIVADKSTSVPSSNSKSNIIEWIVVNDGSLDQTCQAYRNFVASLDGRKSGVNQMSWNLLSLPKNSGKGAAVQAGMLASAGHFALMVDADGATDFGPGLESVLDQLANTIAATTSTKGRTPFPIVFGSRAHLQEQQQEEGGGSGRVERTWVRKLISQAFHLFLVLTVGATDIQDTQCGFKLFPREVAQNLFHNLHLRRWAFDTELVYLANHMNYRVKEAAVPWHEVEGSKLNTSPLNLILVSVSMLRDMICVRLCYTLGLWTLHPNFHPNRDVS